MAMELHGAREGGEPSVLGKYALDMWQLARSSKTEICHFATCNLLTLCHLLSLATGSC